MTANKNKCPPVPSGGQGARGLAQNTLKIREYAKKIEGAPNFTIFDVPSEFSAKLLFFYRVVRTGGRFDTKNIKNARGKGLKYPDGQDFGDFQYGASAEAFGLNLATALAGAEAYSISTGNGFEEKRNLIISGYLYSLKGC